MGSQRSKMNCALPNQDIEIAVSIELFEDSLKLVDDIRDREQQFGEAEVQMNTSRDLEEEEEVFYDVRKKIIIANYSTQSFIHV